MTTINYHIFTNNLDEWTNDLDEANALFDEWAKEYGCCRLYAIEVKLPETDEENDGDCIRSVGEYPY